jgi:mannose-6-phosphate isomerase-like protein (cupin superfamily)
MTGIVLEMTLPVGHAPALHIHDTLDDNWYVLQGQMAARCGDDEFLIESGCWVSMPRGVPHGFRVVGDQAARILVVHDSSTFRDFVRELSAPAAQRVPPPIPSFRRWTS